MRKKPILLVTTNFPPVTGGSAIVYERLAALGQDRVMVLTARRDAITGERLNVDEEEDRDRPYRVWRVDNIMPAVERSSALGILSHPYAALVNLWLLVVIVCLVRRHGIGHICLGELNSIGWIACLPRFLFGAEISIYTHGEEVNSALWSEKARRRRARFLKCADKVFCVSSFTRDLIRNEHGIRESKLVLVPNGVNTDLFTPPSPGTGSDRPSAGERYRILSVGRLVERKGFDRAIEAVAKAREELPGITLDIVGGGPDRDRLERAIAEHGLEDAVVLRGKIDMDELLSLYRSADLFLMPNRTMPDGNTEGFGLVFLEANACGVPVIGGRAGGAVDAISDGETGYLVDPNNADEIAARITGLLIDRDLWQRMSENGLAAAQAHSWQTVANRFLDAV